MPTFSNYKVIEHYDLEELQRLVNQHLEKGWEPTGGIAITTPLSERQNVQFAQAIVFRGKSNSL